MAFLTAATRVSIFEAGDSWRVAHADDPANLVQLRDVELKIEGDRRNGYHLIMRATGCVTADTWHATQAEAIAAAADNFGLARSDWRAERLMLTDIERLIGVSLGLIGVGLLLPLVTHLSGVAWQATVALLLLTPIGILILDRWLRFPKWVVTMAMNAAMGSGSFGVIAIVSGVLIVAARKVCNG